MHRLGQRMWIWLVMYGWERGTILLLDCAQWKLCKCGAPEGPLHPMEEDPLNRGEAEVNAWGAAQLRDGRTGETHAHTNSH